MKILLFSQWFDPEPGTMHGLPLAKWLRARGHEVKALTGFPNYPGGEVYPGYNMHWREWQQMDGIPVLRVPLFPSHSSSVLGRIANFGSFALSAATIGTALIGDADVCYVYHPPATVGLAALALKLFRRMPFVYHIADMWPESVVESGMVGDGALRAVANKALVVWCRRLYQRASHITVVSAGFKQLLISRGVPAEKVEVIYNWTQDDVFLPQAPDRAVAAELGLAGRFNVVYAGNIGPFQGLDTVVRAAALLRDQRNIQFVIVGRGQCDAQIRQLAVSMGLENVRFIGARPYVEMPKVNALADVLLVHLQDLPFFTSTIPGKLQVALASGRPLLVAVRGEAGELVGQAAAGERCEPQNERAMADAILRLYRTPREEREAMGRRGREFYLREMCLEVGGRKMEAVFQRVVATA